MMLVDCYFNNVVFSVSGISNKEIIGLVWLSVVNKY